MVFRQVQLYPATIITSINSRIQEFQAILKKKIKGIGQRLQQAQLYIEVYISQHWQPPPKNEVKYNVDAS